ncbi:MAG: DUF2752 domain-containing protein [Chitinophagaceae bacterium]|nr:DUF2752 domain-containing protein [Chitinophagaceae bacterium]
MKKLKRNKELIAWVVALLIPIFINPAETSHFTLCVFNAIGFNWCPGCGLGRSIASFYRGNISQSLEQHWFGIAAVFVLAYRILYLSIPFPNKKAKYESTPYNAAGHST